MASDTNRIIATFFPFFNPFPKLSLFFKPPFTPLKVTLIQVALISCSRFSLLCLYFGSLIEMAVKEEISTIEETEHSFQFKCNGAKQAQTNYYYVKICSLTP